MTFLADIALPFLWVCSAASWPIRSAQHTDDNLYSGLLDKRTHAVVAVIVLTSTLSRCLRQLHPSVLAEVVRERRIVDGRNALDRELWRGEGWVYRALGRH